MDPGYVMRRMRRAELDHVVRWAAAEGWNPGLHDADAFFAADPGGFFVGTLDGELIASISVVRYREAYAFLGFYIVRPEFRGKGLGLRLWDHALGLVGDSTIGLDGVVDQIPAYERSGFRLAYRSARYATSVDSSPAGPAEASPVREADLGEVQHYDARVFGTPRPEFLEAWLSQPGIHARVVRDGGRVTGYGAIRAAVDGYRIGPLFADAPVIAETLLDALRVTTPSGAKVAIDVPGANPAALGIVEARGMRPEFETARMYRGAAPPLALANTYGVTSFELG